MEFKEPRVSTTRASTSSIKQQEKVFRWCHFGLRQYSISCQCCKGRYSTNEKDDFRASPLHSDLYHCDTHIFGPLKRAFKKGGVLAERII